MSGNDCLLDTNIVIGFLANDGAIIQKIESFSGGIFIPSTVLGELFYGAEQSTRKRENQKKIEEFAAATVILVCDLDTARWYGRVKGELKIKGKPIPENDIWIAALAYQHQPRLITRDKHFSAVEGLSIEVW